jgi:D-alanyl-D-alanine-carboxypeptidase/D-alanyl-D-alanine-endopeptidase
MKIKDLAILLLLVFASSAAAQTNDEIKAKTAEFAAEYLQQGGVGLMIGIIKDGGETTYSYGTIEKGKDQKPDSKTLFMLGSVTKVFTSTLLARYVEKGLVRLDDPLQKWVPPGVTVPKFEGKEITLAQLATHTSGLPRSVPTNGRTATNLPQMYTFLNHYQLMRAPGFKYEYSNLGYGLLANALARAAGIQLFYRGVNTEINSVLSLHDTVFEPNDDQAARRAKGYGKTGQLAPYDRPVFPALNGSGALYSTMDDMLKFLSFNMDVNQTSLNTLLPMLRQPRHDTPRPGMKIGLGWEVHPGENPVFTKDGMVTGFSSYLVYDKNRKIGIVVLSNSGARSPIGLGDKLLAFLTGATAPTDETEGEDDN